ncbi:MAG: hypothetical protein MMC33_002983 [Icmadophila ericetorum]|nr:hypothetical protein [Icmadophila ericetorum]
MSSESRANGDTQPLSQWVYEQYANGIKGAEQDTNRSPETQRTAKKSATPHTYVEGQAGHIDLLGVLDATPVRRTGSLGLLEEDDEDAEVEADDIGESQLEVRAELYPESKRFRLPETPATNGKKRDYNGEVIGSARTSAGRPVNPLAGYAIDDSGIMDLSQVFRATQAASSPGPGMNHALSDGPLERPSPAMDQVKRPSTAGPSSSPARIRFSAKRAVPEPHSKYISMKESQEQRERELRRRSSPIRDISDDEFSSEELRNHQREIQRRREEKARKQFMEVTAEPRPRATRGRLSAAMVSKRGQASSPLSRRRLTPTPMVISDDLSPRELGNHTEDETEHEEDQSQSNHDSVDELAEDNKENVQDDVHVRMTGSKRRRKNTSKMAKDTSPTMLRFLELTPDRRNIRDINGDEVDELANDDELYQSNSRLTQTTAIADSQPLRGPLTRAQTQNSSENHLPASSSPSPSVPSNLKSPQQTRDSQRKRSQMQNTGIELSSGDRSVRRPKKLRAPFKGTEGHSKDLDLPGTRNSSSREKSRSSSTGIVNVPQSDVLNPSASAPEQRDVPGSEAGEDPNLTARQVTPILSERPFIERGQRSNEDLPNNSILTDGDVRTPRNGATRRSTIPETSSAIREVAPTSPELASVIAETPRLSVSQSDKTHSSRVQYQHESKVSEPFETARTHMSEPPSKTRLPPLPNPSSFLKPPSMPSSSLPVETKKARKFVDIAEEPTPPDEIGDVDVDIEIMTAEDIEFQALMEGSSPIGPRRKRRRRFAPPADPTSDMEIDQPALPEPPKSQLQIPPSHHKTTSGLPTVHKTPTTHEKTPPPASSSPISSLPATSPRPPLRIFESEDVLNSSAATTSEISPSKAAPVQAPLSRLRSSKADVQPLRLQKDPQNNQRKVTEDIEAKAKAKASHSTPSSRSPKSRNVVTAPNRVLAHFMGNTPGFYPATCLSKLNGPEHKYQVRFDDGTLGSINATGVKRLELRVGDIVKVDKPGARITNWIVQGFGDEEDGAQATDQIPTSSPSFPSIDIFGHQTVLLQSPKKHDDALWAVPLVQIYLNQSLWIKFNNRSYSSHDDLPNVASDILSPPVSSSTVTTPKSRGRRAKMSTLSKAISNPPLSSRNVPPIFDNMVFSITGIEDLTVRNEIEQGIRLHGGLLLNSERGFEELFDVPRLEPATPPKWKPKDEDNGFQLNASGERRGFTCLISDGYNRKPKYLQALALGIPCLATRWVTDCIAKQKVLPWERYILPSGTSTFLDGAVRGRLLPAADPSVTPLSTIIEARPQFLADDAVIVVMPKKDESRMMSHPFIAYALGAKRVARVASLEEARQSLLASEANEEEEEWDWVCYYEAKEGVKGEESMRAAESIVWGGSGKGKRKRGASETEPLRDCKTRVVTTEFVIQSLILGDLVDEE